MEQRGYRDDDMYGSYGRRGTRRYYQQNDDRYDDGSMFWWEAINSVLNFVTGPKGGVLVALGAVAVVQYRDRLMHWHDVYKAEGFRNTLVQLLYHMLDMVRVYYQTTQEYVRTVRSVLGFGVDDAQIAMIETRDAGSLVREPRAQGLPPLVETAVETRSKPKPGRSRNARRRKGKKNQQHQPARQSSIPGLETSRTTNGEASSDEVSTNGGHLSSDSSEYHDGRIRESRNGDSIEPAFLNEEDYPPGWLMFHPELGVVSREEAQQYQQMQKQKQKQDATKQQSDPDPLHRSGKAHQQQQQQQEEDIIQGGGSATITNYSESEEPT